MATTNDDFFLNAAEKLMDNQPPQNEENIEEVEKVKLGEKEYTQEELSRLVGLGEIATEAEEKYNRPISKFWPEYTKSQQELATLKEEIEKYKATPSKPASEEELSQTQIETQARDTLAKLGYVQKDEVEKIAYNMVQGYQLRQGAQSLITDFTEQGYPSTTVDDILNHMATTGIQTPEKAYKDMFESEIDRVKEQKLASLKPSTFVTQSSSTAGSKAPAPQKVTSKNLNEALLAALPD